MSLQYQVGKGQNFCLLLSRESLEKKNGGSDWENLLVLLGVGNYS